VINAPWIFKRTVKELKFLSIVLVVSVFSFVFFLLLELIIEGGENNHDVDKSIYWQFIPGDN